MSTQNAKIEKSLTFFLLPPSPFLPVLARVRAVLYSAKTHTVCVLVKLREFKKSEF